MRKFRFHCASLRCWKVIQWFVQLDSIRGPRVKEVEMLKVSKYDTDEGIQRQEGRNFVVDSLYITYSLIQLTWFGTLYLELLPYSPLVVCEIHRK